MPDSLSSPPPEYVTTRQAAKLHDVTPSTIRSWANRGLLTPVAATSTLTLYRTQDVDRAEQQARRRDRTGKARARLI